MAANPMQRKIRNSFILGIFVMLVITILLGALVYFGMIKPKLSKNDEQLTAYVYRLKEGTTVKFGEEITSNMVESVEAPCTVTNQTGFIPSKKIDEKTKKTIDLAFPAQYKSKLELTGGTILTKNMLYIEEVDQSERYVEFNVLTMPTTLEIGDYIDVRFKLSSGQDLIVISKKIIENIYDQTVGLNLTEDEILLMNSAIVESFTIPSSELYLALYVDPALQESAKYTYTPTADVINLIHSNENIITEAKNALIERYNTSTVRSVIDTNKSQYAENIKENVEERMKEQAEAARKAREDYLKSLNGY